MESDKTVVQLCNELSRVTDCDGESVDEVDYLADLIVDAHLRELAELRECLKEACDNVCFKCRFGNVSYPYYCGNNCDRMAKWRKALEGANNGK